VGTVSAVRFHDDVREMLVDIETVKQADRNPNQGDVEAIAESIVLNGYAVPVIARRDTREIIAGNHRYAALLSLGATLIPVIWVDMNDEQAARFLLADNRTARLGRDDLGLLAAVLDELDASRHGLLGTGYTHEDLSRFHQIIENPLSFDSGNDARQRVGAKSVFECPECGHRWGPGLRVTPSEDYL